MPLPTRKEEELLVKLDRRELDEYIVFEIA